MRIGAICGARVPFVDPMASPIAIRRGASRLDLSVSLNFRTNRKVVMSKPEPCAHCGGNEFFGATVDAGGSAGSVLPVGSLHGPRYENVICGQCGHTEWFVSKEHLTLVREKLKPLN